MTLPHGGEMAVTQDSPFFEVTFDYEFLEDFQEKQGQSIRIRHDDGKSYDFRSESGYTGSEDGVESTDGVNLLKSTAFRQVLGIHDTWENDWGPVGFKKSNHPLNIMVSSVYYKLLAIVQILQECLSILEHHTRIHCTCMIQLHMYILFEVNSMYDTTTYVYTF